MRRFTKIALTWIAIPTLLLVLLPFAKTPPPAIVSTSTASAVPTQEESLKSSRLASKVAESAHQAAAAKSTNTTLGANRFSTIASGSTSSKGQSELRVSGILGASDQMRSIALVNVAGLPPALIRVGDEFFGWQVVEIGTDEVQLRRDEENVRIPVNAPAKPDLKHTPSMDSSEAQKGAIFYAGPRVAGVPGVD